MAGFEATVLTMNTRAATLFEGIANNAILIAHDVTEIEQLPDEDAQIGLLLALCRTTPKTSPRISPGAKSGRSRKWQLFCAAIFWSPKNEPANFPAHGKPSPPGRMYLPAYRSGTEKIAELRRTYPAGKVLRQSTDATD